jgi:fermentation-respiration switch protein FrsA (DUF1100 family)/predicted small lipoprotein YifL
MTRNLRGIAVLFLVAFSLAACGSSGVLSLRKATPAEIAAATRVPALSTPVLAPTEPAIPTPPPTDTPTVRPSPTASFTPTATPTSTPTATPTPSATPTPINPLSIEYMRQQQYPGSDLVIEQTLAPGANYARYIASYLSDGLKINGLLTVPRGEKPPTGWPVIIFNHGYIPPTQYRTTERYVAYQDGFARNGYITFKSDYRGHGSSEGEPSGAYGSPDYTTDVLNALASLRRFPDSDPARMGMWGHSMGGSITLRAMVIDSEIKAGVIWAGVVAPYADLLSRWRRPDRPTPVVSASARRWRDQFLETYGSPETNPAFWKSISPNAYLEDVSGPIQLHHGNADTSVPLEFSETLYQELQDAKKPVELYTYEGDNHNLSQSFATAMKRSVEFFDKYVKNAS